MSNRMRTQHFAVLVVAIGVAGVATWLGTDALERNNDFCNDCHIEGDVPLHIDLRHEFDARPPRSLAALHGEVMPAHRPEDPVMRCFDCHSGVGFAGRARIKALAARDLVIWLAGRAEEPQELTVPLRDEDCRQCHALFGASGAERAAPPFHSLDVHNHELGVDCTTCHVVHDEDVDPSFHFLATRRVRTVCGRCHSQFQS